MSCGFLQFSFNPRMWERWPCMEALLRSMGRSVSYFAPYQSDVLEHSVVITKQLQQMLWKYTDRVKEQECHCITELSVSKGTSGEHQVQPLLRQFPRAGRSMAEDMCWLKRRVFRKIPDVSNCAPPHKEFVSGLCPSAILSSDISSLVGLRESVEILHVVAVIAPPWPPPASSWVPAQNFSSAGDV